MRRFFAESFDVIDGLVRLGGEEASHIKNVLRLKPGNEVLLINGKGKECLSEIKELGPDFVELILKEERECAADPGIDVTLLQCLPKQGKMEVIIQKCVELGIGEIIPVISKRCIVKPDGKDGKALRWNKVAAEAAKQCGRASVPKVSPPVKLDSIDFGAFDQVLFAYENESERSLKSVLKSLKSVGSIAILIGPEGGFDPSEAEYVIGKGGVPVSLGRRILRTETAGMAMLAQIMYELEE